MGIYLILIVLIGLHTGVGDNLPLSRLPRFSMNKKYLDAKKKKKKRMEALCVQWKKNISEFSQEGQKKAKQFKVIYPIQQLRGVLRRHASVHISFISIRTFT